jgi:hypothetical protein
MQRQHKSYAALAPVYSLSYSGGEGSRILIWRTAWAKLARPYLKNKNKNKTANESLRGIEEVVELLV